MDIYRAAPKDADLVAKINNDGWRTGYAGLVPDEALGALNDAATADRWRVTLAGPQSETWLLRLDGPPVGFVTVDPRGELHALYVAPEVWGRRVSDALLEHGEKRMAELGAGNGFLWTIADNPHSRRFYERNGWVTDDSRTPWTGNGVTLDTVRYEKSLVVERSHAFDRGMT